VQPLQAYLEKLHQIHSTGGAVKETSFYPALSLLFDPIGKTLKPSVFWVSILKNLGAGFPDGGFFTQSQNRVLSKEKDDAQKNVLLGNVLPERGVLEVKGVAQDLDALIVDDQVDKYLERYGVVLATNLREFALLGRGEKNKPRIIERFSLCGDAKQFWSLDPAQLAKSKGEECAEFIKRCLLHGAPLQSPQDVAAFLASYARAARLQLEEAPLESLASLKSNLESALGIEFKAVDKPGKKLSEIEKQQRGEHFFRATLVQTLFYGLFSAWLSHIGETPDAEFRWKEAQYGLRVPMVAKLFQELVGQSNLKTLDLQPLLELATDTLNRVEVKAFLGKWGEAQAVQYFYEPFLEAFDSGLRKDLGVYYTPPEIVRYMVERVHRVLQTELGIAAGLADEKVVVLDPCCGTGAFILETLRVVGRELKASKPSNQVAGLLKDAALKRVFGFEILPAPFVVAHHGVADLLKAHGVEIKDDERAPIYLTNALTGWDSPPKTGSIFPEFKEESERATEVKQQKKILVILGNPPYDAFAKMEEEGDLTAPYKVGLREKWGIKKYNLDDLYVRFFRVAQRKLEGDGEGVLAFISNYSWTQEPSFVVMREQLLQSFDAIWIENMHGNRKISERTPNGESSQTVFALAGFSSGIQQGVTISTLVKKSGDAEEKRVFYNDNLQAAHAEERRQQLLVTLNAEDFDAQYERVTPAPENRFSLRPRSVGADHASWPKLTELAATNDKGEPYIYNGPIERRGNSLIAFDKETIEVRLKTYFDAERSNDEVASLHPSLMMTGNRIVGPEARVKIQGEFQYDENKIVRYPFKPFDLRWCYLENLRPLFSEPSPELIRQSQVRGNAFFVTRDGSSKQREGAPMLFSSAICDYDCLGGHARHFPIFVVEKLEKKSNKTNLQMFTEEKIVANYSERARAYLSELGFDSPDADANVAALLWRHALAIGYAPQYRAQHAGGLASDWPRVPLPADAELLGASAALGARVAVLLDVATPVEGIESGSFDFALEPFGELTHRAGKPVEEGDASLEVTENWGYFAARGIVQPGGGKIETRAPDNREADALEKLGCARDTPVCDIWASEDLSWSGVPKPVSETIIGGYPVIKKWLSYRDHRVLGRALHLSEAREVENMVRRLTSLWALENKLDSSYESCASESWSW